MPLSPERRTQLDDIVVNMADQNAPQEDVDLIVNDFISKFGNEQPVQPTKLGFKQQATEFGKGVVKSGISTIKSGLTTPSQIGGALPQIAQQGLRQVAGFTPLGRAGTGIVEAGTQLGSKLGEKIPERLTTPTEEQKVGFITGEIGQALIPSGQSKLLGKSLQTIGKVGKTIGGAAYEKVIPLSKGEAGLLQKYKADNPVMKRISKFFSDDASRPRLPATTAVEKGLVGTQSMIGVGAKRTADNLWKKKISPAVGSIKEKVNRDELFTEVLEDLDKIADPTTQASRMKAFDAILTDYKNLPEMSYTKAQQIKSELARGLPNKVWRGEDITGDYNNIRKLLAGKIREKTYSKLKDVNIKKDYLDYGNLLSLQELGKTAMTGQKLKGGFGSFWSEAASRAVTPIATIGGQVLYKVGDITFQSGKGLKYFGDYLDLLITKKSSQEIFNDDNEK